MVIYTSVNSNFLLITCSAFFVVCIPLLRFPICLFIINIFWVILDHSYKSCLKYFCASSKIWVILMLVSIHCLSPKYGWHFIVSFVCIVFFSIALWMLWMIYCRNLGFCYVLLKNSCLSFIFVLHQLINLSEFQLQTIVFPVEYNNHDLCFITNLGP